MLESQCLYGQEVFVQRSEVAWRKSSRSNGGGQCIEVAVLGDIVAVRDSKNPGGGVLRFPREAWTAFISWVRQPGS
ncbi:DUF397 domain-containing protein [Actinoplanes sp. TFC3]|uniref:DUF397 domain-containing protein n=1 Tax=Actinoplanes sp. TFC3 TaxID=1710355 RepID=UPI0009EA8B59|nr:DUF397 domain-containing protein [Actinoplanes sp. TFC3]